VLILSVQETNKQTANDLERLVCRYKRREVAQIIKAVNHVSSVHESQPAGHAHLLGDRRHRQSFATKHEQQSSVILSSMVYYSMSLCDRPLVIQWLYCHGVVVWKKIFQPVTFAMTHTGWYQACRSLEILWRKVWETLNDEAI